MNQVQKNQAHWEHVYETKSADKVSWFQPHATRSLELVRSIDPRASARVIDVGGGASTLVDDLLDAGFDHLSVLDLSANALEVARQRLGPRAARVQWLVGDIVQIALPEAGFDVWHDRAVFHFLTEEADRAAYVRQVMRAVKPGGHVIVATFAPDGPTECSGLPVARYSAEELHGEFGPAFELIEHARETHETPWGALQHFVYCHCVTALGEKEKGTR